MSDWLDMADAPRDGTRIIGWFGDRCAVVFWRTGKKFSRGRAVGDTAYWSSGYYRHPEPECWQPAPAAPEHV